MPPVVLPSARIFTGPGDPLFECNRIWVVIFNGAAWTNRDAAWTNRTPRSFRFTMGRNGDEQNDLALLTHTIAQSNKGTKYSNSLCVAWQLIDLSSHAQWMPTMSCLTRSRMIHHTVAILIRPWSGRMLLFEATLHWCGRSISIEVESSMTEMACTSFTTSKRLNEDPYEFETLIGMCHWKYRYCLPSNRPKYARMPPHLAMLCPTDSIAWCTA